MKTQFDEIVDSWVFCRGDLLTLRWERARALVRTDTEREIINKIGERIRDDIRRTIREGKMGDMPEELILQVAGPGRYTGPLVHDRFQVMECAIISGHYYVVDHLLPGLVVRKDGPDSSVAFYASREEAENAMEDRFTRQPNGPISARGAGRRALASQSQETTVMARKPKEELPAAPPVEEKPKRGRSAKAAAAPAAPAKKAPRTGGAAAPAGGGTAPEGGARRRADSPAAMFQKLIMEGKKADDEIFMDVKTRFALDDKKRTYVAWYRNYLKKNGQNPPDAIKR